MALSLTDPSACKIRRYLTYKKDMLMDTFGAITGLIILKSRVG